MAGDDQVFRFISALQLIWTLDVGYVRCYYWPRETDSGASLWTRDKRLMRVAQKLKLSQ